MDKRKPHSAHALKSRIADSRGRLYRVAYAWCGDAMLADDLVQETMTAGIVNSRQLRGESQLYAWLYSILRNNWYRHMRRVKSQTELDDQYPCSDFGPLYTCQESQIVNQVRQAVATLPIDQRQVLSLVDLEQLTYCEVAQILEIPIGTVMSRLHRARKNLLAKMDGSETETAETRSRVRIVK